MGKKKAINSFESELAIALKTAAVQAAANLIRANPELTLEDFYTVMRPQGVTETITIGELSAALAGEVVIPLLPPAPAAATKKKAIAPTASAKPRKPRKPKREPEVDCRTIYGQQKYHASIVAYLRAVDDWVSGPDIRIHCGGTASQLRSALLYNLISDGIVEKKGETYGSRYRLAKKGRRNKTGIETVAEGEVDARTHAGRDAYHTSIMRYLRKSKAWRSGVEISETCGGNKSQRNRAMNHLIEEGLVEDNGKLRQAKRYRAK